MAGPAETSMAAPPPRSAAAAAAGIEPTIALPRTAAEQAEGLPIATIEIVGNRRVAARRRPLVPAREAGPPLQGREPHGRRPRPLGLGLLRGHRGRPRPRNDKGVALRFLVRERPNIKDDRVRGQRRDRQRQAQRGDRDQAEHDPERAGGAPQRAEDQGRLRREGLLPRRRRLRRSSRSARTRSSSSSRSPSTSR